MERVNRLRNSPANTKARGKGGGGGGGGASGNGAEIAGQPVGETTVEQTSTWRIPRWTRSPWRIPRWTRWISPAGSVACAEPTLKQAPGTNCGPWRTPMPGQSYPEGLQAVDWTYDGAGLERLQPMGRTHAGAEKNVRRKERQEGTVVSCHNAPPFHSTVCGLRVEEMESHERRREVEAVKKRWAWRCFRGFWSVSHHPALFVIGTMLNESSPSRACFKGGSIW